MTTYTIGLGFNPVGITPAGTTISQIFGWASGGAAITGFAWPMPSSDSINNIADLAHAAVNGHGDFFNVNNPADLADAFAKISADVAARTTGRRRLPSTPACSRWARPRSVPVTPPATGAVRSTQVTLKTDSTVDQQLWGLEGRTAS